MDAYCTLVLDKGQTFINTHICIRWRLCHFSEPHPWKTLSFPWVWDIGVPGKAMPMLTVHIHSGLHLLPTIEHGNDILIWSLLSQCVAVTVNITKTLSYSSIKVFERERQQVFEEKMVPHPVCYQYRQPSNRRFYKQWSPRTTIFRAPCVGRVVSLSLFFVLWAIGPLFPLVITVLPSGVLQFSSY